MFDSLVKYNVEFSLIVVVIPFFFFLSDVATEEEAELEAGELSKK